MEILFFYAIGILFFILGLEERKKEMPVNIIYLALSFLINYMAYELSYSDITFTSAAYLPLILCILTVIILLWVIFETVIKPMVDTTYKEDKD